MSIREKRKKIISRVSESDYSRLECIVTDYNFKSVYSLMQYIMYCFLRAADREHDIIVDGIEEKILQTFNVDHDAKKVQLVTKVLDSIKSKYKIAQSNDSGQKEMEDLIHEEIQEMFDEQVGMGKKLEKGFYLIERSER